MSRMLIRVSDYCWSLPFSKMIFLRLRLNWFWNFRGKKVPNRNPSCTLSAAGPCRRRISFSRGWHCTDRGPVASLSARGARTASPLQIYLEFCLHSLKIFLKSGLESTSLIFTRSKNFCRERILDGFWIFWAGKLVRVSYYFRPG
jgi:hypothetical protein